MSIDKPEGYNHLAGGLRVLAVWILVALLVVFARPTPLSISVGVVFVVIGEAVRFWAAGHLHRTEKLITSGPYRYTRNPLYLGRLLIFTGIATMTLLPYYVNWIVLLLGYVVFFGYYMPRKERIEPARLREAHGETYDVYFKAVPELFPRLTPWPNGSKEGWRSIRMRHNREYWMVIALGLITLLLVWRAYAGE